MRNVYWWSEGSIGWTQPNFGDEIVTLMLESAHVKQFQWSLPKDADFVICGSILEHLPHGWAGTVCGAGMLHESTRIKVGKANIMAVRGKLTLERLKGLKNPDDVVLGDPALLLPSWVRQYQGKWDVGIIPHWSDKELWKRFPYGHFIDVTKPPLEVVEDIAKCKRVISSSLHGIIVADAYGIPRRAELPPDAMRRFQHEGGDFKWRDYASIFDGDPHFGEFWTAPYETVGHIQDDLRQMLAKAMGTPEPPATVPAPERPKRHFVQRVLRPPRKQPQVSILTPFRDSDEHRTKVWDWLKQYWEANLESYEIVVGHDSHFPFSKASAVNEAASRARGRIFAIIDADCYYDTKYLQQYLDNIDTAVAAGKRMWYIPYSRLYRLSQAATESIITTDPKLPYEIPSPPPRPWLDAGIMQAHDNRSLHYGHRYGALTNVLPREAFFMVGGFDPRMRGWGSEDVSFMRAVDTIYTQHDLGDNDVIHLWHARPGMSWDTRRWVGQADIVANSRLAQRYANAVSEPGMMRALTSEYEQPTDILKRRWRR